MKEKGLKLAVASSAGKDELAALLDVARAKSYFDTTTDADDAERSKPDADDAERSKPDPDVVQAALRKLCLPPERCVLVGDTPYDAQAARSAGVGFVGLRCGGWQDRDLEPASGVYNDPAVLLRCSDAWLTASKQPTWSSP